MLITNALVIITNALVIITNVSIMITNHKKANHTSETSPQMKSPCMSKGGGKDSMKLLLILFVLITNYTVVDHQYISNDQQKHIY